MIRRPSFRRMRSTWAGLLLLGLSGCAHDVTLGSRPTQGQAGEGNHSEPDDDEPHEDDDHHI